jgi:hypothetical protein
MHLCSFTLSFLSFSHKMLLPTIGWCVNYTIWPLLETFFTNGPAWKHIPDLNPLKGARPVGVLIVLRGDKGFATLPSTSKRIKIEGHTIGALLELNATDVGIMFCMWFILFNIFTWLKIIIYITLKSRVIFLFIEKCIMNKFCHCEKLQFIIV